MSDDDRPRPSEAVDAWLAERWPNDPVLWSDLRALRDSGDMPPHVAEWIAASDAWQAAWEERRCRLPFERNTLSASWRMFGGEWLPHGLAVEHDLGEGWRHRTHLVDAAYDLMPNLDDGQRMRLAGAVYDWQRMRLKLDNELGALVMDLRRVARGDER